MGSDNEDFAKKQQDLLSSLARLTKASQFVNPADVMFLRSSSNSIANSIDATSNALLSALKQTTAYARLSALPSEDDPMHAKKPQLSGEDVIDRFDLIVDVIDDLLEKTDVYLDTLKKTPKSILESASNTISTNPSGNSTSSFALPKAYGNHRPQLGFQDKIDNSFAPFIPRIQYKPHAKIPLDLTLVKAPISSSNLKFQSEDSVDSHENQLYCVQHPYRSEIETIQYPVVYFKQHPEEIYRSLESTPLTWIDTPDKLETLCSILEGVTEFAVDLEHHDFRSYQGFTCLMQISTRTEDFLVDTLILRNSLHALNTSFANPQIVKVFHGAEMDIQWLQRDFGVYVVDLFDTYHASHALELEGHSLAFLLKYYCDVVTDKRYQLADWRIRPLPKEMVHYARMDTHYLLYIFDRMRNELLNKSNPETHNLMHVTLERSGLTSLNTYQKAPYCKDGLSPNGWRSLLNRLKISFNEENLAVFKAIHEWRDRIARKEDESLRFVLPNHMLQTLSRVMPTDGPAVVACCSPTPSLVRLYSKELAHLIFQTVNTVRQLTTMKNNAAKNILSQATSESDTAAAPVHIRFDDTVTKQTIYPQTSLAKSDAKSDNTASNIDLTCPESSTLCPMNTHLQLSCEKRSHGSILVHATKNSRLFTSKPVDVGNLSSQSALAIDHAARIRSRLVLQSPAYTEATPKKPFEPDTPSLKAAVVTATVDSSDPKTDPIESDAPAPNVDDHTLDIANVDTLTVARSKPNKTNKRQRKSAVETDDVKQAFTPFDYSVNEASSATTHKQSRPQEVYSPFGEIVTKRNKPIRSRIHRKSGSKSKTFKSSN
ncbi:hypothetical protein BATDEDRAFT_27210 [Batrachochytrium dendrobatidis JAM81]|uniref:HRDC domain-containing protein n=1 Tax=Batrachochytrium dendrobatidis (strain JAM81 / FGSC 10211) TaxID=684364 RepID=F4P9X9_BATDJ|nr:exosome nuclease subunit RRP6 [Batrachochytrium dendrobatidis JAM81]EGF78021.1 hypothetical protein BATDEDRAFT_27210 [Batrachochytrium dendrobatidis JAM81]|eukprot:XP_006681407.1 hypothetical protein BATDEDRAFT_27210 [Batrachochytrium dendrobatidis JAM81]